MKYKISHSSAGNILLFLYNGTFDSESVRVSGMGSIWRLYFLIVWCRKCRYAMEQWVFFKNQFERNAFNILILHISLRFDARSSFLLDIKFGKLTNSSMNRMTNNNNKMLGPIFSNKCEIFRTLLQPNANECFSI